MTATRNSLEQELEWLRINSQEAKLTGFHYAAAASNDLIKDRNRIISENLFHFDDASSLSRRNCAVVSLSQLGHIDLQLFRNEIDTFRNPEPLTAMAPTTNSSSAITNPLNTIQAKQTYHQSGHISNTVQHVGSTIRTNVPQNQQMSIFNNKSNVGQSVDIDDSAFLEFDLEGNQVI